ncbi:hypothetical protein V6N11_012921 [Hibiscus sabdariffa]|uniref:Uncharacterized protein n=1 Tax=Hibiscus sabdariffa TaxID=183260 RepID=A0ABR2N9D6_9ROSI
MLHVGLPNVLERHSSPVSVEDQRDFKKAWGAREENLVVDLHESASDMDADYNYNTIGFEAHGFKAKDTDRNHGVDNSRKATHASMVMKDSNGFGRESYDEELSPDKEARAKELYGPWLIATNRRRRSVTTPATGRSAVEISGTMSGSRFDVLQKKSSFDVMEADIQAEMEDAAPHQVSSSAKDAKTAGTTLVLGGSFKGSKSAHIRSRIPVDDQNRLVTRLYQERSDVGKGGSRSRFSNVQDNRGKGVKESLPKGLKIWKGLEFQLVCWVPIADWAQLTSDRIQVDIEAIRCRSQENAIKEDGREDDYPHAFSPSSSVAELGLVDGKQQGRSGVPSL